MPRVCFVTACKSGYKTNSEKVSLFKVPADQLATWQKKIPRRKDSRKLTTGDFVCEKHFRPDLIIREINNQLYSYPLVYPKLATGAIPSIFPGCPKHLSSNLPKNRRFIIKHSPVKNERKDLQEAADCNVAQTEASQLTEVDSFSKIMLGLLNRNLSLDMPSDKWNISFGDDHIIVYRMSWIRRDQCILDKKIIFGENTIKYYILDRVISIREPLKNEFTSLEDFQMNLKLFDRMVICSGGLEDEDPLSDFKHDSYYKDVTSCWRHVNCSMVIEEGSGRKKCSFCTKFPRAKRYFTDKKIRENGKRSGLSKADINRKRLRNIMKREKRLRVKNSTLLRAVMEARGKNLA